MQVGAVVHAETKGAGKVEGDINASASTQGIENVDPAAMLQALQNPAVTGGGSDVKAYSISATVDMDVVVNMQAEAQAMQRCR